MTTHSLLAYISRPTGQWPTKLCNNTRKFSYDLYDSLRLSRLPSRLFGNTQDLQDDICKPVSVALKSGLDDYMNTGSKDDVQVMFDNNSQITSLQGQIIMFKDPTDEFRLTSAFQVNMNFLIRFLDSRCPLIQSLQSICNEFSFTASHTANSQLQMGFSHWLFPLTFMSTAASVHRNTPSHYYL